MQIINPATEEVIKEIVEDTEASVKDKFQRLKKAQQTWAQTSVEKRVQCIQRFYDLLDKEKDELAKTLTSEVGKPLQQSYNEINGARTRTKFFIDHSAKWLAEEWVMPEGATREKIVYEPLGVVGNINECNRSRADWRECGAL